MSTTYKLKSNMEIKQKEMNLALNSKYKVFSRNKSKSSHGRLRHSPKLSDRPFKNILKPYGSLNSCRSSLTSCRGLKLDDYSMSVNKVMITPTSSVNSTESSTSFSSSSSMSHRDSVDHDTATSIVSDKNSTSNSSSGIEQDKANESTAKGSELVSCSSGFSSDEEIQKNLGFDIMKIGIKDMPMQDSKMKEVTGYLETQGNRGHMVEKYIRSKVNAWHTNGSNIGVVGESGVGKSALINYLCGKNMDKFKSKEKRKSCRRPKAHSHVSNKSLQFWECPLGMGYENSKYGNKRLYWDAINGNRFDAFILVTKNYVKGLLTWFSKLLKSKKIPHFIVRTAIDESIQTSKARYPLSHDPSRIVRNAKELITKSYSENGGIIEDPSSKFSSKNNFFVIDNFKPKEYQMSNLVDSLLNNSSVAVQSTMSMTMPAISSQIISSKIEALRERVWLIAIESAAAGAKVKNYDGLYCDFNMIKEEINLYKKQLNISDEILETVGTCDDPLAGLNDIKYNNTALYNILEESITRQTKEVQKEIIQSIKNVSFRWWLQHQKALPSFCAVGGMLKFLLVNFEDLSRRMLNLTKTDQLDECAV